MHMHMHYIYIYIYIDIDIHTGENPLPTDPAATLRFDTARESSIMFLICSCMARWTRSAASTVTAWIRSIRVGVHRVEKGIRAGVQKGIRAGVQKGIRAGVQKRY